MSDVFSRIVDGLGSDEGFIVVDHFLSSDEVNALAREFENLRSSFTPAKIGRTVSASEKGSLNSEIRRDETLWFDPAKLTPDQLILWSRLDELREFLNGTLYLGLWELEGHFARYQPGGFYRRHLDRFRSDDARTVSVVFYLNENWKPVDGGSLRIYLGGSHVDIEPTAGRLVCFLSDRVEHEVLEAFAERRSFAGWFRRRG